MNILVKTIIEDIIKYLNCVQSRDKEHYKYSESIKKNYYELKNMGKIEELYSAFKEEFLDSPQMHFYLLSLLIYYIKDDRCIEEMFMMLSKNNMNLTTQEFIRNQLETQIFQNSNLCRNYALRRKAHGNLLSRFESMIQVDRPYRPYSMRNKNRIVIVITQLLSDLHAPTHILKEICYLLQNKLGKEVLLIVPLVDMYSRDFTTVWYNFNFLNFIKEYNGDFTLEYKGEEIQGFQMLMNEENISTIQKLINIIYKYNPAFVWFMGTNSLFADSLRKFMTVVSMQFTNGYSISEAQIQSTYFNTSTEDIKVMEKYNLENNQKLLKYNLVMPIVSTGIEYKRADFGLDDEKFLITIVGNRLDIEVDEAFVLFLRQVILLDENIDLVFIGECTTLTTKITDEIFMGKVKFLGYQEDLLGVLGMMNLFLNPPRQGGGTGAIYSLYNGVPVVTLGNSDVADFIPKEDICENKDDMLQFIKRCIKDLEFYKEQSKKAKKTCEERNSENFADGTKEFLNNIEKLINDYEGDI